MDKEAVRKYQAKQKLQNILKTRKRRIKERFLRESDGIDPKLYYEKMILSNIGK